MDYGERVIEPKPLTGVRPQVKPRPPKGGREQELPELWVYIVQAGERGPIKIGSAGNVQKRLSGLQTGHYEELHLVAAIPDVSFGLQPLSRAKRVPA